MIFAKRAANDDEEISAPERDVQVSCVSRQPETGIRFIKCTCDLNFGRWCVADTGPSWRANNNDNSLDIVPHHRAKRVGESITEQVRWATGTGWACPSTKPTGSKKST